MIDVDKIVRTLAPAVSELGLDLYDVEVSGSGRARVLRVMVDREGGVDLEAIADATQAVSPLLDAPPLDARDPGAVRARGEQPGSGASAPHARALRAAPWATRSRSRPDGQRVRGVVAAADDAGSTCCSTTAAPSTSRTATSPRRARCSSGAASRNARSPRKSAEAPRRNGAAMNSEMMEALENIEREKGISIEIMLEALANALLTAYKRMPDAAEEALVEIDMETGDDQGDRPGARRGRQRHPRVGRHARTTSVASPRRPPSR